MDTRFDLYLIKSRNSEKINKVLDELYDLTKDTKDLDIKVFINKGMLRDYRPGSIRLVGYFDNTLVDNLEPRTSSCRVSKDRAIGVELYGTNARLFDVNTIKHDIEKCMEFFNKLITKINQ